MVAQVAKDNIAKMAAWWVGPKGEMVDVNAGDIATHSAWAKQLLNYKGKASEAFWTLKSQDWVRVRQNCVDSNPDAMDKDHYMLAVDKAARWAVAHNTHHIRLDIDGKHYPVYVDLPDVGEFLANPAKYVRQQKDYAVR
jgi:hypothetical protein